MQTTRVAAQLRAQIHSFGGMLSPHFSKPKTKFLEQMLFGLSARQDCKLSQVGRALGEPILLKKTAERLARHLATPGLGRAVQRHLVAPAAPRVKADTLSVVDPTDGRKPYAQAMPHLGRVRDGSPGEPVNGYWACVALAGEPQRRRGVPLMQELWSAAAPDFESENPQWLAIVEAVAGATDRRGVYVLDRGGERMKLYEPLLARGLRFLIRLRGDRHVVVRGRVRAVADVARGGADALRRDGGAGVGGWREEGACGIWIPARAPAQPPGRGVESGGGERAGTGALDAPDECCGAGDAAFGVGGRERLPDAVAGGGNHPVHPTELPVGSPAGVGRRTAAQPGGAGEGGGVLCGGVAGRVAQAGGAGDARQPHRQTLLRRARVSLLRPGRWAREVALATGATLSPVSPHTHARHD